MSSFEPGTCREVALPPGWAPYALAGDAAGALWMTVLDPPGLARMSPGGEIRHEALSPDEGRPMLLTVAADGALWCTRTDDRLTRRDASGGHTVIDLEPGSAPYGIAAAPGGDIWFTAPGRDRIGRVCAAGTVTSVELPVADARAAMLTVDAGGHPWAALNAAGALACVRDGTVRLVELPGGRAPAAPVGIAASPAGIWYADIAGGCVGRVDPSGSVERIVFADAACRPHAVAADTDGACWVTLWGSGQVARVAADGEVTVVDLPGKEPHGLWVEDSRVWVAMESGSLVAIEKSAVASP
ncbi:hydrolase [Couchioplanes caeruleus]|uniref:Vgb family protein n=1 Tax=Couchioplanes caeruleus TaxID=56438 RepID=UPI0020C14DFF|nr:hydrolase [Couchioplanes caeruleus]UQU68033.1 hydrolase [Couchioplanes caeruleus]